MSTPPRGQIGGGTSAGGPPPGMTMGGTSAGAGGGQGAGTPPPPETNPSFVEVKTTDHIVTVTVEVVWKDDNYRRLLNPRIVSLSNQTKGKMAVYAGSYGLHPLAEAVKKYTATYKAFPRGTSDRPVHIGVGLAYPPSQRVSFFTEFLPFLERSKTLIGPNRSIGWAEEKLLSGTWIDKQAGERSPGSEVLSNIAASELWVPELLVPYYPATAWRATSPLAPDKIFGGTNFVAIAGVGVEAARLDPTHPDAVKKVGISGYTWGSKLDEVTDGLANTIYLMQVPPGLSRPWRRAAGRRSWG